MRYVSGLEKVQLGDYILTTGQDGIYPPGLTIGEVVQVKPGSGTQSHEILIRPGAKFDQLEEVAGIALSSATAACSTNRPCQT